MRWCHVKMAYIILSLCCAATFRFAADISSLIIARCALMLRIASCRWAQRLRGAADARLRHFHWCCRLRQRFRHAPPITLSFAFWLLAYMLWHIRVYFKRLYFHAIPLLHLLISLIVFILIIYFMPFSIVIFSLWLFSFIAIDAILFSLHLFSYFHFLITCHYFIDYFSDAIIQSLIVYYAIYWCHCLHYWFLMVWCFRHWLLSIDYILRRGCAEKRWLRHFIGAVAGGCWGWRLICHALLMALLWYFHCADMTFHYAAYYAPWEAIFIDASAMLCLYAFHYITYLHIYALIIIDWLAWYLLALIVWLLFWFHITFMPFLAPFFFITPFFI